MNQKKVFKIVKINLTESSAAKTKLYIFKLFVKYMFGNN